MRTPTVTAEWKTTLGVAALLALLALSACSSKRQFMRQCEYIGKEIYRCEEVD